MTRAYSYVRFSTPEQAAGDSYRRQSELASAYATKRGLELDDELTFEDLGKSAFVGDNLESGQLGNFLQAVRTGLVERGSYLLVESLDRISRNKARRAVRVLEEIVDAGITLVTLQDGAEYTAEKLDSDPMSFLMSFLIFIRANEESATKARRISASWNQKRSKASARALTRQIPSWLRLKYPDKKPPQCFQVIPERAAIVRRIFQLALAGVGQEKIATKLNKERVPQFGRGKLWRRSFIHKILLSRSVVGIFSPHVVQRTVGKRTRTALEPVQGYYPAIIDKELFDRVAGSLESRNPARGRHSNGNINNLFGGLSKCPKCGTTMTLMNKGRRGGKYMVCVRAKTGGGCEFHALHYDKIEAAFLRDADRIIPKSIPPIKGLKQQEREIELTQDKLDGLLEAIGVRPSVKLADQIARLEETQKQLTKMRDHMIANSGPMAQRRLTELRVSLRGSLDRRRVNMLLRETVNEIEVAPDGLSIWWKFGKWTELKFSK
jgi:DNA invertase Pin-like site-specific DNA recombinase